MRKTAICLLLLTSALAAPCPSAAQSVKKCVDADGNITFIQGDCPKAEAQQDVTIHPENRSPHGELRFPAAEPGLEWVWVASVLDDNDGGVIVRESGDPYLIETGRGCDSLWRYQERFAQVMVGGDFGDPGTVLLLPDHEQGCLLHAVKPAGQGVDLGRVPAPAPAVEPAPAPAPAAAEPVARQPRYTPSEPADEGACRSLRRRYKELNVRCRGLEECDRKRVAIDDLKRRWTSTGCEGAIGMGL